MRQRARLVSVPVASSPTGPGEAVRPTLEDVHAWLRSCANRRTVGTARRPEHGHAHDGRPTRRGRSPHRQRPHAAGMRTLSWDAGATNLLAAQHAALGARSSSRVEESLVSAQTRVPGISLLPMPRRTLVSRGRAPEEAREPRHRGRDGWRGCTSAATTGGCSGSRSLAEVIGARRRRSRSPSLVYDALAARMRISSAAAEARSPAARSTDLSGSSLPFSGGTTTRSCTSTPRERSHRRYRADIWITHTDLDEAIGAAAAGHATIDVRTAVQLLRGRARREQSSASGWPSPARADALLAGLDQTKRTPDLPGGLTRREVEVARLVAQGRSNREIADEFVLSERTVESHVQHILTKLSFTSRTEIATWAVRTGVDQFDAS